jgi:hypothetical protein
LLPHLLIESSKEPFIEGEPLACADPPAGFIADHFHLGGIVEIATGII